MYSIYVLYINTVTDITFQLHDVVIDVENRKTIRSQEDCVPLKIMFDEVVKIYDYANECFETVAKSYKSTLHRIFLGSTSGVV